MADVIKEFLIGLGFKVDEKGLKKFTSTIDGATTAVTKLVTTLAGASLTVAAGVSAFASNLEELYFASQRIGSSADSIKAAEYAARDLGATASELRGSLEGLSRFLRDNPGGEGFLQSLGVETRDINGNIKDTTDLLSGLGQKLRSMPWYQARQYASVLGIDENTLRAIINGDFARKVEQNRKTLAGSGLDQATKDAHAFMEQLRDVGLQFENMSIQVQAQLMHRLGPELEKFAAWFEKNSPMIAARIVDVIEKLLQLAQDSGPYLQGVYDFFVKLDAATDGWSTKIIVLLGLLRMLGATSLITGIARLSGAFAGLAASIAGVATAAALISGDTSDGSKAAQKMQDAAIAGSREAAVKLARQQYANQWWRKWFGAEPTEEDIQKRADEIQAGEHAGRGSAQKQLSDLERKYDLPAGLLDSVWDTESARGRNMKSSAGAEGHFQFMPETAKQYGLKNPYDFQESADAAARMYADLLRQYGGDVRKALAAYNWGSGNLDRKGMDSAPAETRNYIDKVLAGMARPIDVPMYSDEMSDFERARLAAKSDDAAQALIRANAASQFESRAPDRYAMQAAMGQPTQGNQVVIHQKTDVNVSGGADPAATGQAVAGAQGRVNEELVRNMTSAVQ